jgi:predicted Abi (CAAX) family protease
MGFWEGSLESLTTSLIELIKARIQALLLGYTVWPGLDVWLTSLLLLLIFGLIARWQGLRSGIIREEKTTLSTWGRVLLGARLLLHPAVVEESIFRGLLIPSPTDTSITPTVLAWIILSWLLFILAHPINSLILKPQTRAVFTHPVFLILAGLLAICTSALYWISASLWPAILFHWIVVFVWMTRFGGLSNLSRQT